MKWFKLYITLFYLIFPFSLFAMAPYSVIKVKPNPITVKEFIDMPISKIEQRLGKKLKGYKRLAIKKYKRKLKKQAKENPKILEKKLTNTDIENIKMDSGFWLLIIFVGLPLLALGVIWLAFVISCNTGDGCF